MSGDVIFFVLLGLVVLVVIVWVVVRMPRGSVAEVAVEPGVPFELRCSPADSKHHRVCLHFSLTVAGRDPDLFGIACQITGEVDGKGVVDEVVGVGYRGRAAGSVTMDAKTRFKNSTTRLADGCKVSETAVLIGLGPRPLSSEIAVRGLISTTDNVSVHSMKVAITR